MNRLTEKNPYGKGYIGVGRNDRDHYCADDIVDDLAEKMGPIEDIEEKIKVDFKTLETACRNGFYSLYFMKIVHPLRLIIFERDTRPYFEVYDSICNSIKIIYVADCGKTWAVTREELE